MSLEPKKLARILYDSKVLTEKQINDYYKKAQKKGLDLYHYLIQEKKIEKNDLGKKIATALNVNYIDLTKVQIKPEVVKIIPEIVAKENQAIVFAHDDNGLHLAMTDPTNQAFIDNFEKRVDENVIIYFTDEESIYQTLSQQHHTTNEEFTSLISEVIDGKTIDKVEDISIIKIVNKLLQFGHINKASDIHVEPYEDKTMIRFRIDGMLHDIVSIPKSLHELVVMRIKILSRLRTDEHQAAQDGKLRLKYDGQKLDVRVSIVPIIYGEKVVMRLLSEKASQYDSENLGFRKEDFEKIQSSIKKPWGMILTTGPTGCGKTTTLYSIIKKINKREINISTIEDPVEYDIEGINQIQVNAKTNLTFSKGLRAIVRQDPDIIMVGEIRDEETAKIAINSAMTGHLVLSTLHTNDAATALPRLLDMSIQPFLVASSINIVIAQRLVRKICQKCKYKSKIGSKRVELIKKELSAETLAKYKLDNPETMLYFGQGCEACQNTGYQGRIGIFELLEMNDEIKEMIMAKANAVEIKNKSVEFGMLPIIEDGISKALKGTTTIDEILRVAEE